MSAQNWKDVERGPIWLPALNLAESNIGLPTDLLARIAYQESHFIEEIIRGTRASAAGALGIMQLMPKFFTSVNVARPYTDNDVVQQIAEAGHFVAGLFQATHDWDLTIAAYNAGLGNVRRYSGVPPFKETQDYVAEVIADLPSINGRVA